MPLYEFRCDGCQSRFERYLHAWGEEVSCPECHGTAVERLLLSTFAMTATPRPPASAPGRAAGGRCGGGCRCGD